MQLELHKKLVPPAQMRCGLQYWPAQTYCTELALQNSNNAEALQQPSL